ncbi:MAG TPA: hypothetical protein VEI95_11175, partial [Acidobacteriota bacterium]|nr:hypothetical protein [Acidobacteriota bacterium]
MYQTQTVSTSTLSQLDLAVVGYAKTFRVIGQELAALFPRVLEIETDGVNFAARGESHPNPFEAVKQSILRTIWNRLRGKGPASKQVEAQPPPANFTRTYGPEEIDRIDRLNSANRTGTSRRADSYSLAERLRTMGDIVDKKNGRLKRLGKDGDRLFVEYWDQQGQLQTARLTTVIM